MNKTPASSSSGNPAEQQRIEHWISQLEEQAASLLMDIDFEELSQKERLTFGLKILSQIQHFLTIKQKLDTPPTSGSNIQIMLQNLTRQMRGEGPVEVSDSRSVVVVEEEEERDYGPSHQ